MLFSTPQRIDLSLPLSFNRCSLAQLRQIAAVMLSLAQQADSFHPFTMTDVKIAAFFALTNLEVTEPLNPRVPVEEQYYMVRFRHNRIKTLFNKIMRRNEPFALYLWQINSWLFPAPLPNGRKQRGMLDWLDKESGNFYIIFPFELVKRSKSFLGFSKKFHGPNPMLDGFSWQRYRFAQDYMKNYMEQQNVLVRLQQLGKKASANDIITAYKHVDMAKALFLANIFEAHIAYTDESTGQVRHDWHYQSNQASDNAQYFRNFPDIDWQVILLWWSGIMAWLGKTYPKVFKEQNLKSEKYTNPLELYARATATIEKYVGLNAEEVEREPYTAVLQQMNDMAVQNEEMEKARAKH